ncbi:hypothetical protein AURDEDRAFT_182442 [Auricularia subglabra TFB-10046 SS5]|nr:hypothetical protein AURDEDRAFT_182442 [Auricularia subglabra TFB-10046 SS5]
MALLRATNVYLRAFPHSTVSRSYGVQCRLKSTRSQATPQRTSAPPSNAKDIGPANIAAFFAAYPTFNYDPKKNVWDEWRRLRKFLNIDSRDKKAVRGHLKDQLQTAVVRQFNHKYGTDVFNLESWQKLCRRVGVPVPGTIEECQKVIAGTHVNILDLTTSSNNTAVVKYATEEELADYTNETERYFPRNHVEAGDILLSDSSSEGELEDVADFFAEYPSFDYNPRKDVMKEFQRLCRHRGLDPDDKEDRDVRCMRGKLKTAMVRQFNDIYGTDDDNLEAWQSLCRRVDIPVPDTVEECEEAIRGTHVNLIDLTTYGSGRAVKKYDTEVALADYTRKTEKFFPSEHADAGALLNNLLRHILNPRPEWQRTVPDILHVSGPRDVAGFFATYPAFDYDSTNDCMSEWRRLCAHQGVDPDDREIFLVRDTKRRLRKALVRQFNTRFGTDVNNLGAWQDMCRLVDIPVPDTLAECQQAIRCTHVNLVDLTECNEGETVVVFPTEVALSEYSQQTDKIFPKDELEAGSLLRSLLRHIDHPRPEWRVRGTPPPGKSKKSKARRGRRSH